MQFHSPDRRARAHLRAHHALEPRRRKIEAELFAAQLLVRQDGGGPHQQGQVPREVDVEAATSRGSDQQIPLTSWRRANGEVAVG